VTVDTRPILTRGVCSSVVGADGDVAGHVALVDADDVFLAALLKRLRDAGVGSPTAVFESGAGCHAWVTGVRDASATADLLAAAEDDPGHLSFGLDRGYWRIRTAPKVDADGDVYREAPRFVRWVVPDDPDGSVRISAPHVDLVASMDGAGTPDPGPWERVGDRVRWEQYATFTDCGKAVARRAE
jgi:hypothetical protein